MKKYRFLALAFICMAMIEGVQAQVFIRARPAMAMRMRSKNNQQRKAAQNLPKFEPSVNLSVGYSFPNLDKNYLPQYYNAYTGNTSQQGPIVGAIDYQFSRNMSIGLMVSHASVSAPYYDYSTQSIPAFTAKLESWSYMLNLIHYMPSGNTKVQPYARTAIGINSWTQTYTDAAGNKAAVQPVNLPDLAYQVGIGAKFNLSQHAGFFVEAGYGKYIVQGGLALKF